VEAAVPTRVPVKMQPEPTADWRAMVAPAPTLPPTAELTAPEWAIKEKQERARREAEEKRAQEARDLARRQAEQPRRFAPVPMPTFPSAQPTQGGVLPPAQVQAPLPPMRIPERQSTVEMPPLRLGMGSPSRVPEGSPSIEMPPQR
jgi:hypothetical protein